MWDVSSGQKTHTLAGHVNKIDALAFNADGRWFAFGSDDGSTRIWEAKSGDWMATLVSLRENAGGLTAAQSYQAALEATELGHGLLTYALVEEGLKQHMADAAPHDGRVLLQEWLDYATKRVPQMQEQKMQQGRSVGANVAFVEGGENVNDVEKRSVQRPRVFYRRDTPIPLIAISSQAMQPTQ